MEISVSHTAASRIYIPESALVARTMLSELRGAHRNLRIHLEELESLSSGPLDIAILASARWKLGQASLSRRLLSGRICEYFLTRCDAAQVTALQALRDADRVMLRQSADHLRKWTSETIVGDWRGYCRDGRAIRGKTCAHIAAEQRLLYPLLERSAERGERNGNGASDGTRTRDLRRDRPAL
jgi:hypothetical protein